MASGDLVAALLPLDNEPPSSAYATFGVRNGHPMLVFPDAVVDLAIFTFWVPPSYAGGGVTVTIDWMCSTTSTNKACFGAYLEHMDVGTTDFDADSFASEVIDTTGVAAKSTSGIASQTVINISGANLDGIAAGDLARLKIARETGQTNDTNAGDIQVLGIKITET